MRFMSFATESISLRLLFLILLDIFIVVFSFVSFFLGPQWLFLRIIFPLIALIIGYFVYKDLEMYGKGADGENDVRRILRKLPSSYHYLGDFMRGKHENTDFIVIGPTGVWTIEVKNEKHDKVSTNMFLEKYLDQAYREGKSLSDSLSLPVNSVLVFTNPKVNLHYGLHKQKGVYVIGKKWLFDLIQNASLGTSLSSEETLKIYTELKKYTSII